MSLSEAAFARAFRNAPVGMAICDATKYSIIDANEHLHRVLGHPPGGLLGKPLSDLSHNDSAELLLQLKAMSDIDYSPQFDHEFQTADGGAVSAAVQMTAFEADGRRLLAVAINDLRARMEREEMARRREAEAIGLEHRADFIAMLTHDLKTPVVGANMVLGALLEGSLGPLEGEQRIIIEKLRHSNQALLKMIHNLLEVYRYEAGPDALNVRYVDIMPLLRLVLDELRPLTDAKKQTLSSNLDDKPCLLNADDDALHRVLINLLSNAVKYTPEGGTIQLVLERHKDKVIIKVIDNGAGIEPEDISRLFQRFWQGAPGRKYSVGVGLGLYFCHRVLEAHGGKIVCESSVGKGTTFVITLPVRS